MLFEVKGWNVSASNLKTQTVEAPGPGSDNTPNESHKKSKKRKRADHSADVNDRNVGELYKHVFEGNSDSKASKRRPSDVAERSSNSKFPSKKKHKSKKAASNGIASLKTDEDVSKILQQIETNLEVDEPGAEASVATDRSHVNGNKITSAEPKGNDSVDSLHVVTANEGSQSRSPGRGETRQQRKRRRKREREQGIGNEAGGDESKDNETSVSEKTPGEGKGLQDENDVMEDPSVFLNHGQESNHPTSSHHTKPSAAPSSERPQKHSKKDKRLNGTTLDSQISQLPPARSSQSNLTSARPSSSAKTPLQSAMATKLLSSRFRHLNATLYSSPSTTASSLFTRDPQAFSTYHTGFRNQLAQWPTPTPLETLIAQVRARCSPPKHASADVARAWKPLPRHPKTKVCRIVDLGAGEAEFAAKLSGLGRSPRGKLEIRSFDLAKPEGLGPERREMVEVADTTDLEGSGVGVETGSVDLAICCLSLMGTNWVSVVEECSRIVRPKGEVWVAEVKSRFQRRKDRHSALSTNKKAYKRSKKQKSGDGEDKVPIEGLDWRDEVEGEEGAGEGEDKADETDVAAFVDVWKRRGFELREKPDVENKMFVVMYFVKTQSPRTKVGQNGDGTGDVVRKRRWAQVEDGPKEREAALIEEGKVLKGCLYKTR